MARDLQVSQNCNKMSRNWGNLIDLLFVRKKFIFVSYFPKCVSLPMNIITLCGPFLWGKHLISLLEITENSCYYPLPTEPGRLPENRKKFCYYPPPPNLVGFWRWRKRLRNSISSTWQLWDTHGIYEKDRMDQNRSKSTKVTKVNIPGHTILHFKPLLIDQ